MRNTIYRYFFKEFISFFVLILISISVIVWIVQAVNYLDFVTEDGHAFNVYFAYSVSANQCQRPHANSPDPVTRNGKSLARCLIPAPQNPKLPPR